MSDSDSDEIIVACLLIEEEERRKKKRHKRFWVHNIHKKRSDHGEFHTLFPDLMEDDNFFQYYRMTHEKFTSLLDMLLLDLTRQNTSFRKAVGPNERFSVSLRYLCIIFSFYYMIFSFFKVFVYYI